jgi:ElaB/YqjD/DUF883 family membrane-anchored ribosome-binding protein
MEQCYQSYRRKNVLKTARYLLKQECCDEDGCSQLVDDLQDLQFKCNDMFENAGRNSLDRDEKGNIKGTVCSLLKDKKNKILDKFNGAKLGGKKTRKRNKKQSRKTRMQRYKKKT